MGPRLVEWCRQRDARLCVLFGSHATGEARPDSDVDLVIWPSYSPSTAEHLHWLMELEMMLGREVSLVLISPDLNPVLGFEIVRNGQLIFESEPHLWARLRNQLWHAYCDALPFRRLQRQLLHQYVEEIRRGA